jgi:hypothetical protein
MVFIYGLIDPFTFKVRYIGKTINLKQRFDRQMNERSNTHRCHWIQSLRRKGKKPTQVVLQELNDDEDWQAAEIKWISISKKYGWPLVNGTGGGDGVINLSAESRAKITAAWKGRKHRPDTLLKLSESSRGRIKPEISKDILSRKMKGREIKWVDKLQISVRKFDDQLLENVLEDLKTMKGKDVAQKYGVHRTTITKIKLGQYKTYKQKTKNYKKPRRYENL